MKKSILLLLLFVGFESFGQSDEKAGFRSRLYFGVKGGLNITTISNSDIADAYLGLHGGVFGSLQVSDGLGFGTELMYFRQGLTFNQSDFALDYLTVPVMVNVYSGPVLFQAGMYQSFLVRTKTPDVPAEETDAFFKTTDYGMLLGLNYSPEGAFIWGIRLNLGFENINNSLPAPANDTMKFRNTQFTMGYRFLNAGKVCYLSGSI